MARRLGYHYNSARIIGKSGMLIAYISHRRMHFSHSVLGIFSFRSTSYVLLRPNFIVTIFSSVISREVSSGLLTVHECEPLLKTLRRVGSVLQFMRTLPMPRFVVRRGSSLI